MTRYYITFGDLRYRKSRDFGAWAALHLGGFDKAIAYKPEDIDDDFKKMHADIFRIKRGYGLWIWKPYLIYKTLTEICEDGDFLFYGDGGSFFIKNIRYIERSMNGCDLWVSHNPLLEWQFSKIDALDLMGCRGSKYENTPQVQGGFLYIRKSKTSISFIKEWLNLCCDIRLLHPDNIFSKGQNPHGFVAHREDQSLLSLLCKKRGIKLHQDPTQYGKYPEKYWQQGFEHFEVQEEREYPVSVVLHRTGNLQFFTVLRQFLLSIVPRSWGLRMITRHEDV